MIPEELLYCRCQCILAAATFFGSEPHEGYTYNKSSVLYMAEEFYQWVIEEPKNNDQGAK